MEGSGNMIGALAAQVREADRLHIPVPAWMLPENWTPEGETLDIRPLSGVIHHSPEDLVVTAWAGTTLGEVQDCLRQFGQCLAVGPAPGWTHDLTLSDLILSGLPHSNEGLVGPLAQWILELHVMLADGSVVKSGAKVVKSVAGYDAHHLIVGSLGWFGLPIEVTLRCFPQRLQPKWKDHEFFVGDAIHRTLPEAFSQTRDEAEILRLEDPLTSTLWTQGNKTLPEASWSFFAYQGYTPTYWTESERTFLTRAKSLLDPTQKWNAGVLGL